MAYGNAFVALADPTRRTVFERLRHGPRAVGDVAEGLPVSRPAVSQHLKVLKDARLVTVYRDGRHQFYAIDTNGLRAIRDYLDSFWGEALQAFKTYAEKDLPKRNARRKRARR
jgi:DNA-binding transcriptional ArsR family regulator